MLQLLIFRRVPINCFFQQEDFESPWDDTDLDFYDLIHMRMLSGSVTSWPEMYQKIFRLVKPDARSLLLMLFPLGISSLVLDGSSMLKSILSPVAMMVLFRQTPP
jgi:hypothetical protein